MKTLGHKADQPGLRGHSHDPENDLMKRFVVSKKVKHGWLALKSYDDQPDANHYIAEQSLMDTFRVVDQFDDNTVVWDEPEI